MRAPSKYELSNAYTIAQNAHAHSLYILQHARRLLLAGGFLSMVNKIDRETESRRQKGLQLMAFDAHGRITTHEK